MSESIETEKTEEPVESEITEEPQVTEKSEEVKAELESTAEVSKTTVVEEKWGIAPVSYTHLTLPTKA